MSEQPELLDGVLEVKTGAGYRTPTGPSPVPFVPNFKYEILEWYTTSNVQFTDLTTGLGVGGEWEWDFTNNGTVDSILNNPAYDYKNAGGAGIYFVNMTVRDASHPNVSVIKKVDLSKPIAGFSGTPPLSGNSPWNVQFTDTSTGGAPSSWQWEYNKTVGGSWIPFNTTANPLNTFTNGTYDIRLTVTNIFGNSTLDNPLVHHGNSSATSCKFQY